MKEIATIDSLRTLELSCSECEDNGVQYISQLENLVILSLRGNSIHGSGLSNFGTNITILDLSYNSIDDEGANYLSCLYGLTHLKLGNNKISDEGLKNYCKLSNLSYLDLNNNQIGSVGANYLSFIPILNTLILSNNKIEMGFQYLSNCKNLIFLFVSNNNISEESVMKYCNNNPSVDRLFISNNPIGNSGFASLVKLPELTLLEANNCDISDEGISKMLEILHFKTTISLHLETNYLTNSSLEKIIKSNHVDKMKELFIDSNPEFDSKYLNLLAAQIPYFKCDNETQTKPKETNDRCTIQ